jgi:hypothetical protein
VGDGQEGVSVPRESFTNTLSTFAGFKEHPLEMSRESEVLQRAAAAFILFAKSPFVKSEIFTCTVFLVV